MTTVMLALAVVSGLASLKVCYEAACHDHRGLG